MVDRSIALYVHYRAVNRGEAAYIGGKRRVGASEALDVAHLREAVGGEAIKVAIGWEAIDSINRNYLRH